MYHSSSKSSVPQHILSNPTNYTIINKELQIKHIKITLFDEYINARVPIRYRNGKAMRKVNIGAMLRNAHENVADVYCSPTKNRYCGREALQSANQ